MRIGQDSRTSAHFVAFDNKKAYLFYCSCDAFILAFSQKYHYADEMREVIKKKDINKIASIIASCESEVREIEDYQKFIENIDEHVEAMMFDAEIEDIYNEFEEVEIIPV